MSQLITMDQRITKSQLITKEQRNIMSQLITEDQRITEDFLAVVEGIHDKILTSQVLANLFKWRKIVINKVIYLKKKDYFKWITIQSDNVWVLECSTDVFKMYVGCVRDAVRLVKMYYRRVKMYLWYSMDVLGCI